MEKRSDKSEAVGTPGTEGDQTATPSGHGVAGKPRLKGMTGEIGGPEGPEPTRYGDWERKGRCIDF